MQVPIARTIQTVVVFGSSRRSVDEPYYAEARELGRLLAENGYGVMTGGYDGSMAAVSQGAREASGTVWGVTCAVFDPLPPNRWVTEEIRTETMLERLDTMMRRGDAFIAVRGGIGTLSELTLAWSLLQTQEMAGKPLILLGADWLPVIEAFRLHTDLGRSVADLAQVVTTPAKAITILAEPHSTGPQMPLRG
jgi:uncharacterized protein (TIGR00730 family)